MADQTCDDDVTGFYEIHEIVVQKLGHVDIAKGDFNRLAPKVKRFVVHWVSKYRNFFLHVRDSSRLVLQINQPFPNKF